MKALCSNRRASYGKNVLVEGRQRKSKDVNDSKRPACLVGEEKVGRRENEEMVRLMGWRGVKREETSHRACSVTVPPSHLGRRVGWKGRFHVPSTSRYRDGAEGGEMSAKGGTAAWELALTNHATTTANYSKGCNRVAQ